MLFNTEKLQGMPKKIKALARREAEVSLVQQVTITDIVLSFMHSLLHCMHHHAYEYTRAFCHMLSHKVEECQRIWL